MACSLCNGTKRIKMQFSLPTESEAARLAELDPDTPIYRDPVAMGLTLPKPLREDLEQGWDRECPRCSSDAGRP